MTALPKMPAEPADRVTRSEAESPSLASDRSQGAAFEMKFVLEPTTADAVVAFARNHLRPDPHGDPALGCSYDVTTTYLDTVDLDIARRAPGTGARKFRLRRYGREELVWLERKIRRQDRVRKVRLAVPASELAWLAGTEGPPAWLGSGFRTRVQDRELVPACSIAYRRAAWFENTTEGPVRLTLDRAIRGHRHAAWSVPCVPTTLPELTTAVVCEMKFRAAMPALLKALVSDLALVPASFSKYRRLMESLGDALSDRDGGRDG